MFHKAAYAYEDSIRRVFAVKSGQIPRLELIILGMGKGRAYRLFIP